MTLQSCVSFYYSTFVYSLHGDLRERERERSPPLRVPHIHVDMVLRCPLQCENVPENVSWMSLLASLRYKTKFELALSTLYSLLEMVTGETRCMWFSFKRLLGVHLAWLNFASLFYYSAYFYYYSWISMHFLILFMSLIILFQLTFNFINNVKL